jgi:uncharacterized repeat protein (TIGR03803 family)
MFHSSQLQAGKTSRGRKRLSWKRICAAFVLCAATAIAAPAQTFTTLLNFDATNGSGPVAGLIQATDGNLYGTTYYGDYGTVFKITPSGTLTTLHFFDGTDGSEPDGLIQASDGNFYGTTNGGRPNGAGSVFKITPDGTLTTLYTFCSQSGCADGGHPTPPGLVQAANGDLYGTTAGGNGIGYGTVFKITTSGTLTTLHSFCSKTNCADGSTPASGLIQASNGDLYGTTYSGGAYGAGTVFKITPTGTLTTLYNFCSVVGNGLCLDGEDPVGALVQDTNGNFYGTTYHGGSSPNGYGTVFKMTPGGTLTTLLSFDGTDGYGPQPRPGLVQATDGNLYGTTLEGGAYLSDGGTVFKITTGGTLTTLHSFCSVVQNGDCEDGQYPYAGLVQHTNGILYGMAYEGGTSNNGTVYSLSMGLGPFVKTLPTSGIEGAQIEILGQGFTSSSVVEFGGVKATSSLAGLNESTALIAYVPEGALTGEVTVTTGGKTLKSYPTFRVTPQFKSFSPDSGLVGQSVTITGVSLTQTTAVTFGGVKATSFTVNSDTEVTVTVPTGAKTGKIAIATKGGTATSSGTFDVTPQITGFTPTSGPVGQVVTITGVSLTQTTEVTFGGVKATSFAVNSDTQVMAIVPTGAKTGKIGITTSGGTATSASSFTVT